MPRIGRDCAGACSTCGGLENAAKLGLIGGRMAFYHPRGHCRCAANRLKLPSQAPVAQLDRALPSEGKGHTFESCRVRHFFNRLVINCQTMDGLTSNRMKLVLSILSLLFATSAALAVDYRWTLGYAQGTTEAIISNQNDSSVDIYCPSGQEDTTPGMFIEVKRIKPPRGEQVTVQIIVDDNNYPFELNEIQFTAGTRAEKWQFRALLDALATSKRKSFVVEFPKYNTSETFSLLDARKNIGRGKDSIIAGCGASTW
jgi:hypothetical protein